MSEKLILLDTGKDGYSAGVANNVFKTKGRTNYSLFIVAKEPTASGTSGDTFNAVLEESQDETFDSALTRTVKLTTPGGTQVDAITEIAGDANTGDAELLQKYNLNDKNYDSYIRLDPTVVGSNQDAFKYLQVYMTYDTIKRASI